MTGIRPKQLARLGEFYLQEAVLDVLLEAGAKKECIGAAEISKRAGIYREGGGGSGNVAAMNDAIVTGLLIKLFNENKVKRCEQKDRRGGWELTEDEFRSRQDDVSGKH